MRPKRFFLVTLMTVISATGFFSAQERSDEMPILEGPYLGQTLPGMFAVEFAPGIISTGLHDDYGPAIAKDGNEIYFRIWGKPHTIIWVVKRFQGKWGEPEVAPFSGQYEDGGFIFAEDGYRIYFDSDRPLGNKGDPKDTDIWIVDREQKGWGEPHNLGEPINSPDDEYIGSVTADNTIHYTVRKQLADGKYSFVNYSSDKNPTYGHGADVFWVDTKVIEELKPKGMEKHVSTLVLLGEWFGDAYFPLEKEIDRRGWTMKRVGVESEYRGCYNKKRDVVLRSDILIPDLKDFSGFDCLIIPSGPQWRKFNQDPQALQFIRDAYAAGLLIVSFCVGNLTVKAAKLIDFPMGPELFPSQVKKVKERILLGPRGGGPPPGDGFESAPIKEICDAIARELETNKDDGSFSILKGQYLCQKPPGITPEIFAPGIICTEEKYELNSVFSPKGDEFYYEISTTTAEEKEQGKYFYVIMVSKQVNGVWTKPESVPFSGEYSTMDICFSPDGNRLYFTSDCPNPVDSSPKNNIWYVERRGQDWSDPQLLGPPVYLPEVRQGQVSLAANGTIYFRTEDDLYYSKCNNGKFSEPVKLSEAINSPYAEGKPFIAPDESYLLFIRYDMPESIDGGRGLYISFRREDGSWTPAKNTNILGSLPKITPDGKYFFFSRGGDIYWADAKIIENLKPLKEGE